MTAQELKVTSHNVLPIKGFSHYDWYMSHEPLGFAWIRYDTLVASLGHHDTLHANGNFITRCLVNQRNYKINYNILYFGTRTRDMTGSCVAHHGHFVRRNDLLKVDFQHKNWMQKIVFQISRFSNSGFQKSNLNCPILIVGCRNCLLTES